MGRDIGYLARNYWLVNIDSVCSYPAVVGQSLATFQLFLYLTQIQTYEHSYVHTNRIAHQNTFFLYVQVQLLPSTHSQRDHLIHVIVKCRLRSVWDLEHEARPGAEWSKSHRHLQTPIKWQLRNIDPKTVL